MMSEKRLKLHWVTAIIEVLQTAKEMILPLLVLVFAKGFNSSGSGKWYLDYLSFIIFGVIIVSFAVLGIIKWKRFEYWFEEEELRVEYGLFVKKKRYIPLDRIQSLDYTEGILHRPFKLVKVKVETAGNSSGKESEVELTAITKDAANWIEAEVAKAKQRRKTNGLPEHGSVEDEFVDMQEEPSAKSIFHMNPKDLLILATTSGGIGIILSGVGIFLSQFADLIPFDLMYEEVSGFIKFGLLFVAIAVFLGFLVVWLLSVAMTFFSYYGFTVSLDQEDIVITRGLLEKKKMTVPLNRVQSIRIIENPVRQPFGYASVVIDSAGGGGADGAKINLFPLVKKKEIYGALSEVFPDLIVDVAVQKLPPRSRAMYFRIDFVWMLPVLGAICYYFYPYGLYSLLIVPIVMLFGVWQHRAAGYALTGNQLTMRFRGFSKHTAFLMKKRIQSMEMKQNYFNRRKEVATVASNVKSGMTVFKAQIRHMEIEDAERIIDWYQPSGK